MRDIELQLRAYGSILDRADASLTDVVEAAPRRMRRSYIVAIAAAIIVAIVASTIVVGTTRTGHDRPPRIVTPPSTTRRLSAGVLAIGDSVMLGARDALRATVPGITVDATLSRQPSQAAAIITVYKASGNLPGRIVIALGTNGLTTADQLDAIMRAAGDREVWFVTVRVPRAWESEVNAAIRAVPNRWSNAHVIDWQAYAQTRDDWFVIDGFHLTTTGQRAYSLLVAGALGFPGTQPPTTVPSPTLGPVPQVVAVLADSQPVWKPLAVAGGEVWVASEATAASTPIVHLAGHDPTTGKVVSTIDVPQEAAFGLAGYGDTLWVAGGGDGGVPDTTVSRVDVRTGVVVFTKTLTGTPCSCPIFAGRAGVWLTGNSANYALHLSETDGRVSANVALPRRVLSSAAMEARGRLLVGLERGTVAVVDPSTNRVERFVDIRGLASGESMVSMSQAAVPAIGSDPAIDGFMASSLGNVFALLADRWQANQFVQADVVPQALAPATSRAVVAGGDWVNVVPTHAGSRSEFQYLPKEQRLVRVAEGPASSQAGFRDAVAVGNMFWTVYDPGAPSSPTIVVMRIP
ncbi:MAG TPA: hypothetical protein VGP92_13110 [Acidimicrobiia bacterium]|nr:hypothetical protein [Acidimicrobiia bacterium]